MKNFVIITIIISALGMAKQVFAAELVVVLESTGDQAYVAHIEVDTQGDTINALEGELVVASPAMVTDVSDGNSVVSLWAVHPDVRGNTITFSGIVPGGVEGDSLHLFSVYFSAQAVGNEMFTLTSGDALLNDGLGTSAGLSMQPADLALQEPQETEDDTDLPEEFAPRLIQTDVAFDGEYVVVFGTQDKGSGIDRYRVKEGFFSWYSDVESPYHVRHQGLDRNIYVQAIDRNGNVRTEVIVATYPFMTPQRIAVSVLVVLCLVGLIYWSRRRKE